MNRIVEELNTKRNKEIEKIRNDYEELIAGLNGRTEELLRELERVKKTKDLL